MILAFKLLSLGRHEIVSILKLWSCFKLWSTLMVNIILSSISLLYLGTREGVNWKWTSPVNSQSLRSHIFDKTWIKVQSFPSLTVQNKNSNKLILSNNVQIVYPQNKIRRTLDWLLKDSSTYVLSFVYFYYERLTSQPKWLWWSEHPSTQVTIHSRIIDL